MCKKIHKRYCKKVKGDKGRMFGVQSCPIKYHYIKKKKLGNRVGQTNRDLIKGKGEISPHHY